MLRQINRNLHIVNSLFEIHLVYIRLTRKEEVLWRAQECDVRGEWKSPTIRYLVILWRRRGVCENVVAGSCLYLFRCNCAMNGGSSTATDSHVHAGLRYRSSYIRMTPSPKEDSD